MRLLSITPTDWARAVAARPVELLSDHAHCELKAASNAMTMLKRNPNRPGLAMRLAPLIKEESDHLHRVLRELELRGAVLGHDSPNPYAAGLHQVAKDTLPAPEAGLAGRPGQAVPRPSRRGAREPGSRAADNAGYLDVLLVSALIEMRSHERFERLSECDELRALRPLYTMLCEAEARHCDLFLDLACVVAPSEVVEERFDRLARAEAELLEQLAFGYRVHSGLNGLGELQGVPAPAASSTHQRALSAPLSSPVPGPRPARRPPG